MAKLSFNFEYIRLAGRARLTALLLGAACLAACGSEEPESNQCKVQEAPEAEALPGSYIVAFRGQSGGPGLSFGNFATEHRAHFNFLTTEHGADPRIKSMRFLTSLDLRRPEGGDDAAELNPTPLMRLFWSTGGGHEPLSTSLAQVDFTSTETAKEALAEWNARGAIWFAEPNYVSRLKQDAEDPPATEPTLYGGYAADYKLINYWWLEKINLATAFESIATRDLAVPGTPTDEQMAADRPIVAVLDSGVDYEHPALKEHIWVNANLNAAGCENDLHGCNTTVAKPGTLGNGDVWPFDTSGPSESCIGKDNNCSHGTHVAGIVAADHKWTDPEGRPTAGVCPTCRVMVLKIVSKVGKDSGILDSSIIAAFKYVSRFESRGNSAVRVINASFGKFVRSRSVGLLIRLLREKNGTILVAAAGNEDTLTMEYPAAFKDAVAVAAVDSQLRKVSFSNFGRWVDISAPGSSILSTVPGAQVDSKSGTSMAAPMVAGVAGLMVARYPDISYDDLRGAIVGGADPTFYKSDFSGGFNNCYYYPEIPQDKVRQPLLGTGLLNANSAINRTPTLDQPIFSNLSRVKRGCSVVGGAAAEGASPLLLLLLPLLAVVLAPRRTVS